MYIGHLGVGLAAKRVRPALPVLALTVATVIPDLADSALGLANLDHSAAYTHTLPAACGWAVVIGLVGLACYGARSGLILAALCASHVPLDYVTSRLEVWSGGPVAGWLLYATPVVDFIVEASVIAVGWWMYRGTLPEARRNGWAAVTMLAVLVALQGTYDVIIA